MSNEELQKAIDDITKESTAADPTSIAPAVPVDDDAAAPAAAMPAGAVPAGMMPADASAADAMPASDAAVAAVSDATPIAPPPAAPVVPDVPPAAPAAEQKPAATPAATPAPDLGEGVTIGADGLIDVATTTVAEKISNIPTEEPATNLIKVKQDALRELFPLMNKLNIDPVQKFGLYKDIIDLTKEHAAIEQAHETVLQIADEQTRADALLELLEIIASFKV